MSFHKPFFTDRRDAGQQLGKELLKRNLKNPLIFALPRGGVVTGHEVAETLGESMDILICRKIGSPEHEEFGIGAMAEDGKPLLDSTSSWGFAKSEIDKIIDKEQKELRRRIKHYRSHRDFPSVRDRITVLVDDGVATGVTAAAAGKFLKSQGAAKVILAVPVAPVSLTPHLLHHVDEIITLHALSHFRGVGMWYENFEQVEDALVLEILSAHHALLDLNESYHLSPEALQQARQTDQS
jgi:putative phosphoribosyl transferase